MNRYSGAGRKPVSTLKPSSSAPPSSTMETGRSIQLHPAMPPAASIIQLQRALGNEAVRQMMRTQSSRNNAEPATANSQSSKPASSGERPITGHAPVQMVHPAFNSVNYWRAPLMTEDGTYVPHPLSYEGKKDSLTNQFGEEVMKLVLFTDLPEEEAVEREQLTRHFIENGGTRWTAHELLSNYPDDNGKLKAMYENTLKSADDTYLAYTASEAADPLVTSMLEPTRMDPDDVLLNRLKDILKNMKTDLRTAAALKPNAIAIDLVLKERRRAEKQERTRLNAGKHTSGMTIEIYGPEGDKANRKLLVWTNQVMSGLLGAPYLQTRKPPLYIRVIIRSGIHKDIACTYGTGGLLTVEMDRYQIDDFSPGLMLGLLAHELGVHSLQNTAMSKEELEAEALDKGSAPTGIHGSTTYKVGKDAKAPKQQDDHLTIGRAILGQLSAAPRLNMYEQTLVSLISAQDNPEQQKETAAAYCIDIARILVTNDNPMNEAFSGISGKFKLGYNITNAAVTEWGRIRSKYATACPELKGIEISSGYMMKCLLRLAFLLQKIEKHGV